MSETKMLVTDAGLAEIVNAENSGTAPVVLTHIAFGTGQYTATKDMTALKSEFKRMDTITGGSVGDNIIHLQVHDNSTDSYSVYEVGVFTESGTLFAVYSQTTPILSKAAGSEGMLVINIALTDINPESVTIGDTNFILNPATTTTQGTVELATEAEAKAGTDATRAITPKTLDATIEAHDNVVHKLGNETITGNKTFTSALKIKASSADIYIEQSDIEKGITPTTDQPSSIYFGDKNGIETKYRLGQVYHITHASGGTQLALRTFKNEKDSTDSAIMAIHYPAEGTPYATAPTPATGDNSTKIATTAWVNTKAANYLPLTGGTMSNQIAMKRNKDDSFIGVYGGATTDKNGAIELCGYLHSAYPGYFLLHAHNETEHVKLIGKPNGELSWNGKNIVRSVNGTSADSAGNVSISSVSSATKATQDGNGNVITDTYATKSYVDTEKAKYLPLAGGTMSGDIIRKINVDVSTTPTSNTYIIPFSVDNSDNSVRAYQQVAYRTTGILANTIGLRRTVNDENIFNTLDLEIDEDGNSTFKHNSKYVLNNSFLMPNNSGAVMLTAGTSATGGAYFRLYGKDHSSGLGQFNLVATDGTNTKALTGKPDGTLTWDGKDIIPTEGTGYVRFPNGTQIVWGVTTASSTITYPMSFISVAAVLVSPAGNSSAFAYYGKITNTTLEVKSSGGSITASYMVIGKWK